jgi:hypothetical protein
MLKHLLSILLFLLFQGLTVAQISPNDRMTEFPHETIAEEEYNKTPISKV